MFLTGVHGIYKALKAAEEKGRAERRSASQKESRPVRRDTSGSASQKIMGLCSDSSIIGECLIRGIITMKRIHCLKYQVGSVNQPARRHILIDDKAQFGIHHRFRQCIKCRHWLTEEEWKQARRMLEACGGWDEFQVAARTTGTTSLKGKKTPRREAA